MPARALVACACFWLAALWAASAPAHAADSAHLRVKLLPEHLGATTTIQFNVQVAAGPGSDGAIPAPLTELDLAYPEGFGIGTSGLGVESCAPAALRSAGPSACPPDSRMGHGSAVVEVPFGAQTIAERAGVQMFMAPVQQEQVRMLFYAAGKSPVISQIVLPAVLATASPPLGGALDTELPLVSSFPAAPYVSVLRFGSTLGPLGLTYYERVHGRAVAYRPRGIVLPKRCPSGGFPFAAKLGFSDGSKITARTRVPCPPGG